MIFSTVIEGPQQIKIGDIITQEKKPFKISKITKVEFINDKVVLVNGVGNFV
ncbi:hypothetical protein ACM26V_00295 [Salipaludibacillus sp. HK11]|uniref:hypothetical protein n=1 Tax=Salipaludibacillus sp. HK11 TaxID=3394320 RepID=UPI0039FDD9FB